MSSAYAGAQNNRFFADWVTDLTDPNDDFWNDGSIIAARSWDLWRNDPYFRALIETMVELAIGPEGLIPKSQYQEDDAPETDPEEQIIRDQCDNALRRSLSKTRLDAAGILTYAEMSEVIYRSAKIAGMGYSVRLWKEKRPDAYQATAWRIVDPARVSNPNNGADTRTLFQGHELDAEGREVAIYVQKSHPNIHRVAPIHEWQRIPIYDKDGNRQVTIRRCGGRPEQIRTVGCGAPVLLYLRMLQGTTEAWAIAKRIQASYALMIKTEDPAKSAQADKYGSVLSGNVPIRPGQRYYHNHESVEPLNWNFQGNDYEMFRNPIIEAVCAAEGVPYEMVLKRLTKSNLASSRAALMTAYQFGKREQNRQITSTETHWAESIITEDIARGKIMPRTDDKDAIIRFKWRRPPRPWPDPQKEANGIKAWLDMGHSYSGAYDEVGKDFEEEIRQRARDERLIKAQGLVIAVDAGTPPVVPDTATPDESPPANIPEGQDVKMSELLTFITALNLGQKQQASTPVTVVNENRISMDSASAVLMGEAIGRNTPAPVVSIAPAVINMAAAAAPNVTVCVEPAAVHVQAAAASEQVAPTVVVNVPAPIVQNEVRVEVPARTVKATPQRDGSVLMVPQE